MAGNMVQTVPATQTGPDGFAAYDSTRKIVNMVFGNESGTNTVKVTGLSALGSTVSVTLESAPSSGRSTAVTAPTAISTSTYTVSGGAISVPVASMDAAKAYHLVIQPTSGVPAYQQRYEAENASVYRALRESSSSASNGGYVGLIDNSGDVRNDSYVDFVVNVPTAKAYTMTIGYANATGATATQGLAYNGGAWSTISYPPTAAWGTFGSTVSTTVTLKAGYNVIRLAKGAPFFAGGTGYAELGPITLRSPDEAGTRGRGRPGPGRRRAADRPGRAPGRRYHHQPGQPGRGPGILDGPFGHGADGSLYGLYDQGVPSDNLIQGMGLQTTDTKAQDGQQHPGSDALEIAQPFASSGGSDIYIYMTDVYRNFPYERTSYAQYQGYLRTEVKQDLTSPYRNRIVLVPYNEPDGNWFAGLQDNAATLAAFESEWQQTYQLIKGLWPAARIAGPNFFQYQGQALTAFLAYCQQNHCLPNIITWHELNNPSTIAPDVAAFRAAEAPLG